MQHILPHAKQIASGCRMTQEPAGAQDSLEKWNGCGRREEIQEGGDIVDTVASMLTYGRNQWNIKANYPPIEIKNNTMSYFFRN